MILVNENFLKLQSSYLFSNIAKRVQAHQSENPSVEIIRLGIGDVTRALPKVCIEALHHAVDEMANDQTFRGYGPEQGYDFLRKVIAEVDFQQNDAKVLADEIFVSDGAKCDTANIQELFANNIRIAVPDPVYPVYVDTNVIAGRTGNFTNGRFPGLVYLEANAENQYIASPPKEPVDLIYLCYPNNPTGAVATKDQLAEWVEYARNNKALILFDAAYAAFIRDTTLPKSIYEIEGAREVAIEFRSLSKTAGFTGTRCAYTVVPKECMAFDSKGNAVELHALWNRRQTTKFNGTAYPIQRAAAAVFSEQGQQEILEINNYYLHNASLVRKAVTNLGYDCVGGVNSPYVWVNVERPSWEFFDLLLQKAGVVTTPGAGFGTCGEGYIRISAFNSTKKVEDALERILKALK